MALPATTSRCSSCSQPVFQRPVVRSGRDARRRPAPSGAGLSRRRIVPLPSGLRGRAGLAAMKLGLQLLDLVLGVCLAVLEAGLTQLLAGLMLGLALGLLRGGDLAFDVGER